MHKFLFGLLILCFAASSASAAKVDTVNIYSTSMKKNIKCVIITPDSYTKNTKHNYPVLYLLHGYSDNYSGWVTKAPNLKTSVDENNIIVVCPDGGYSSWYFNSPINDSFRYETHITREVLNYTETHYRTIKDRKGRAIAGLSMGGHGALYLSIKHKNLYSAAISLSGGVDFTPFPTSWDIAKRLGSYEDNTERWVQHTTQYLVHTLKNKELNIVLDCGTEDFFLDVNRVLHQTLTQLKIEHDYIERPGKHNWDYWNNAILYQMYYLNQHFKNQLK